MIPTRRTFLAALALGAPALGAGAAEAARWEVATALPADSFHTQNLVQLAKEVEAATEGRLRIAVQAGSPQAAPAIQEAVRKNRLQLGELRLMDLQDEWPVYGLDSVPFLATSHAEARRLYRAQRVALGKRVSGQGVVVLYSVASPAQGLFLKAPVKELSDLRKLRWAAESPVALRMAELVGAKPVALSPGALGKALARREVDAVPAAAGDGMAAKVHEHLKLYLDLRAWLPREAVLMNLKAFEALDKPARMAVLRAGMAAEERGWKASEAQQARALGVLRDHGVEVAEPSAALRGQLQKVVGEPMLNDWLERAGEEGRLVLEAYRRA